MSGDAIASGANGTLFLCGVFSMAAVNDAVFAVGDPLYWDTGAKKLTKTPTAYFAGMCFAAKLETATTAQVALCDCCVAGAVPTGSISAAELASDAVETAKIKDAQVTAAKLATALQALAVGVESGYKVARGVTAVTGTQAITSGLATVVAVASPL
jgi:phage-related minor tail protein